MWVFFPQVVYLLEVWPSWLMQLTCYQTLLHFLSVFLPFGSLAGCQIRKGHLVTTEQVILLSLLYAQKKSESRFSLYITNYLFCFFAIIIFATNHIFWYFLIHIVFIKVFILVWTSIAPNSTLALYFLENVYLLLRQSSPPQNFSDPPNGYGSLSNLKRLPYIYASLKICIY